MQFDKIINEAKEIIIKNFYPEKLILFGSCANNKFKKDSDIDLFVIKNLDYNELKKIKFMIRKMLRSLIFKYEISFDIFIDSPEGFKKRLEINDQLYKEISKNGKVIYEK